MNDRQRPGELIRDQHGYVTLASTAIIVVLISLGLTVILAAGQVTAGHQVRTSADLAAVAGAHAHHRGEDACVAARETVQLNAGELSHCATRGTDVTVEVTLRGRSALARAGPL